MKKNLSLASVLCSLLTIGISACGGGGGSESPNACSALNLRIIDGDNCSLHSTPVVLIIGQTGPNSFFVCTGTIITPTVALTAAHCIPDNLEEIRLYTEKQTYSLQGGTITQLAIHPQFQIQQDGEPLFDYGMLRLATPADASPVPLGVSQLVTSGEPISAYGFGLDENGHAALDRTPKDALKAGSMVVSDVGSLIFTATATTSGQTICHGDSGGPAVASVNGVNAIVGINDFGPASGCSSSGLAGFASVQSPSIYNFIKAFAPDVVLR